MCEGCSWSWICQVVCWDVNGLDWGNGPFFGGCDSFLQGSQISGKGRLITDGGWNSLRLRAKSLTYLTRLRPLSKLGWIWRCCQWKARRLCLPRLWNIRQLSIRSIQLWLWLLGARSFSRKWGRIWRLFCRQRWWLLRLSFRDINRFPLWFFHRHLRKLSNHRELWRRCW